MNKTKAENRGMRVWMTFEKNSENSVVMPAKMVLAAMAARAAANSLT